MLPYNTLNNNLGHCRCQVIFWVKWNKPQNFLFGRLWHFEKQNISEQVYLWSISLALLDFWECPVTWRAYCECQTIAIWVLIDLMDWAHCCWVGTHSDFSIMGQGHQSWVENLTSSPVYSTFKLCILGLIVEPFWSLFIYFKEGNWYWILSSHFRILGESNGHLQDFRNLMKIWHAITMCTIWLKQISVCTFGWDYIHTQATPHPLFFTT